MKAQLQFAAKATVLSTLIAAKAPFLSAVSKTALATGSGPVKMSADAEEHRVDGWISANISWRSPYYLNTIGPWSVEHAVDFMNGDNVIEHLRLLFLDEKRSRIGSPLSAQLAGFIT